MYLDGDLDLILSSRVTQAGRDAIQMLHPKLRLHFFDPNTEIVVEELLVVPSRGFVPEEIMPGFETDKNRLTTDIEAMRLIRSRFQQIFKADISTGNSLYWSRGTANYRKGNSDKILEQRARGLGLDIADLGNLSFLDQGRIVAHAKTSFGFYGSHLNNVATMAPIGSSHLIVTNDRPYEWQTLYCALSELLEVEPLIVQGHGQLSLPYYAPENYHSSTELEFDQIERISAAMSGESSIS
jgi:capsular polysaccharide biosynthesis protein